MEFPSERIFITEHTLSYAETAQQRIFYSRNNPVKNVSLQTVILQRNDISRAMKIRQTANECYRIINAIKQSWPKYLSFIVVTWKLVEFPLQFSYAHKKVTRTLFLPAPHKNCLWIYYANSRRSAECWVVAFANVWIHDAESYKLPDISALLRIAPGSSAVTAKVPRKWRFVAGSFRCTSTWTFTLVQLNPKCATANKLVVYAWRTYASLINNAMEPS